MNVLRFALPALIAFAGITICSSVSNATPAFGKKESKPCTACHTKTGSKELNEAGKYYKEKKTLEGYKAK